MGKPQGIFNQSNWHHFQIDSNGVARETWGGPMDRGGVRIDGFAPNADVTVQRPPYPPDNPYGSWYGVSAEGADGQCRSFYWVGAPFRAADHWEGPVDGPLPW